MMVEEATVEEEIVTATEIATAVVEGQEVIRDLAPALHVESPEVPHVLNQEVIPQEDRPTNLTSQGAEVVLPPTLVLVPSLDLEEEDQTQEMTRMM